MEEQLRQIWADVLFLEPDEIETDDNLFECKTPPALQMTRLKAFSRLIPARSRGRLGKRNSRSSGSDAGTLIATSAD